MLIYFIYLNLSYYIEYLYFIYFNIEYVFLVGVGIDYFF